jgi:hypothetical protein
MDSTFNSDMMNTQRESSMMMTDRTLSSIRDSTPKKRRGPGTDSRGSNSRPNSRSGIRMANPSPLKRSKTPMVHTGKRGNILSRRAEEAVRLKDEQLKLLQNQNKKLLQTIENMETEVQDAKNSVGGLKSACLQAQDENIALRAEIRRAEEEGRLEAEASFQKQIETGQHQIKVMAEQNTELLRMLEGEEKKTTDLNMALESIQKKYKAMVNDMEDARGRMEKENEEAMEAVEKSQQRERELNLELETKQEQLRGLRMNISSLEEKLVKVSNTNVELNSQLLDSQRASNAVTDDIQSTAEEKISELKKELETTKVKLDIESQERIRFKDEVKDQADQLREMAEKVFQLIERLKDAESAKKPLETKLDRMQKDLREANVRLVRVETERNDADKEARRFGNELRKSRTAEQEAITKAQDISKLYKAEKSLRTREQRARREAEETRKALSGRVSYLLNKSALDDESRANARIDVKKLEKQMQLIAKKCETLRSQLRESQEANKVLTEAMRLKHEEIEKLHVDSQMRKWDKKAKRRAKQDMKNAKNNVFGKRGNKNNMSGGYDDDGDDDDDDSYVANSKVRGGKRGGLSYGTGFSVVMKHPKGRTKVKIPGLRADKGDERAARLLKKLQINEFFTYVSSRPLAKHLEMTAEKLTQILGALRLSESLSAARGRKAQETMDRLRSEMDMIRRKAESQSDRIFEEEEAKRKALVKYLSLAVTKKTNNIAEDPKNNNLKTKIPSNNEMDAGSGFFITEQREQSKYNDDDVDERKDAEEINSSILMRSPTRNESFSTSNDNNINSVDNRPERVTIALSENKIGDEEIHALVAVLSSNDNAHVIDLKNNNISNTGCRGLAALLRTTETLEEIDLSGNMISRPGVRTLAEALENNTRVKHVFVHDNGKIEALGTINDLTGEEPSKNQEHEGGKKSSFEGEEGLEPIDAGYVDTILTIIVENQRPEPRYPVGEKKREIEEQENDEHIKEMPGDKKDAPRNKFETPLSKRIKEMEKHLGPRANAAPTTSDQAEMIAILEAEKWATRAENIREKQGIKAVPQDYLATEVRPVPEAYESPLTKRIRDLENRLAITDFNSDKAPANANEMVNVILENGDENRPNDINVDDLPPRPSTTNSYKSRNSNAASSASSLKRIKSAKGSVRSNKTSNSSMKSWRHDSSTTLNVQKGKSLNQQTQINENLRRREVLQKKEKQEQDTSNIPRSRAVRAAYAVRTLDDDQIKDVTVPKDYGQKNTLIDELENDEENKTRRKKRASSASVARRRKRRSELNSAKSRDTNRTSNSSLDLL